MWEFYPVLNRNSRSSSDPKILAPILAYFDIETGSHIWKFSELDMKLEIPVLAFFVIDVKYEIWFH